MTIKKWITAIAGCTLSLGAMAGTMGAPSTEACRPWQVWKQRSQHQKALIEPGLKHPI
jgi:hypothetical protein